MAASSRPHSALAKLQPPLYCYNYLYCGTVDFVHKGPVIPFVCKQTYLERKVVRGPEGGYSYVAPVKLKKVHILNLKKFNFGKMMSFLKYELKT